MQKNKNNNKVAVNSIRFFLTFGIHQQFRLASSIHLVTEEQVNYKKCENKINVLNSNRLKTSKTRCIFYIATDLKTTIVNPIKQKLVYILLLIQSVMIFIQVHINSECSTTSHPYSYSRKVTLKRQVDTK